MLYSFNKRNPEFGRGTYISETALVIGDVRIKRWSKGKQDYIDLAAQYLEIGMHKINV